MLNSRDEHFLGFFKSVLSANQELTFQESNCGCAPPAFCRGGGGGTCFANSAVVGGLQAGQNERF